ncbi:NAD-dependent protein deacetylase Sirt6 [Planococcus citri]|uniref:NAD-dependent protein deacetylase Sirt6 n=1 Tax=Planococcus citri TaxID=170843 RepID=UPI0031F8F05E
MSCSYADGLSPYSNKGKLGIAEKFDTSEEVKQKVKTLAQWINSSKHVVLHTGAGISTSAGIPDFRGPKGVWTLEEKGEKPTINVSFDEAVPTKTHMSIVKMANAGKVQFVISQNIDGLHLRSGLDRKYLAELHGNMFIEQCHQCQRQFVRTSATSSVGQKCLDEPCPVTKSNGRPCRGKLHDTILDWEHNLPEKDLGLADFHSCVADLSICLGTTLQIVPSGILPLNTKKYNNGRLVICNLQPTKFDKKADLLIHTYVDDIMTLLMQELGLELPDFDRKLDPSKREKSSIVEWTIPDAEVKRMRLLYEQNCCKNKKRKSKTESGIDTKLVKIENQDSFDDDDDKKCQFNSINNDRKSDSESGTDSSIKDYNETAIKKEIVSF